MSITPSDFAYATTFLVVGWVIRGAFARRLAKVLNEINTKLQQSMITQAQVAADLVSLTSQVDKIKTEVTQKLQELATAITNQGNAAPEVEAALTALKTSVQAVDDLIPDQVPTPAPAPTA